MATFKLIASKNAIISLCENKTIVKNDSISIYKCIPGHFLRTIVNYNKRNIVIRIHNIRNIENEIKKRGINNLTLIPTSILKRIKYTYLNVISFHGMFITNINTGMLPLDIIFILERKLNGNLDVVMKIIEKYYDLINVSPLPLSFWFNTSTQLSLPKTLIPTGTVNIARATFIQYTYTSTY